MTKGTVGVSHAAGLWIGFLMLAISFGVGRAHAEQTADAPNACGCRSDSAGNCYCERSAKCGCPGECEPKGCEEKRAKQLQKEVEIETKKAEAAARQHRPAATDASSQGIDRPSHEPAPKPPRHLEHQMKAADQRALSHLLELYVDRHPEVRQMTVDQVLSALARSGSEKSH